MYQNILTELTLAVCSVTDIKYRKIYKAAVAGYIALALLGHALGHTASPVQLAAGLLPGIFCFLISGASRQALGYGDSALVLGCGISVGAWQSLSVLVTGLFLSGLWAAGLLVFHKAGKKKEMPFVPFLFLGTVIYWCGAAG